ncbi:MAG TPA: hypothetical protein VLV31_13005 [Candidatus Acidoferrales bacterium]|nr:hypothetical protein [Candidatus Acidoferrales bacterium]
MTYATLATDSGYFDQTLLDSVTDAVKSILGDEVVESLFTHIEAHNRLTRHDIARQPDVFFTSLEEAFGPVSGKTIGRFIIKLLYARLGLTFDSKSNRILLDYVEDARRRLCRGERVA